MPISHIGLSKKLQKDFPRSLHVSKTGITPPISDRIIWQFARQNDFVIVTYDEDFYELSNLYGSPPKIIWLRFGNLPTEIITQKLLKFKTEIQNLTLDPNTDLLEIF